MTTTRCPSIACRSLCVDRGGHTVLNGLDLTMEANTVTGILGPSGSGKSTLLRSIAGVQRISGGVVTVLGRPAGSAALRRRVAYTTQAASVYRDLTVEQNVRYFARLAGAGAERVAGTLEEVSLNAQTRQLAGRLSGGQLARVSLACALVSDPDVLVLDEPTVGLDPVLREELWHTFRERACAGTTVLISSHVMDEALRCDALLLLRGGRILVHETPERVLKRTGAHDMDDAFLTLVGASDEHGCEEER